MEKPILKLSGEDGNVFMIIARACNVLKKMRKPSSEIAKLQNECLNAGTYEDVMKIIEERFEVI